MTTPCIHTTDPLTKGGYGYRWVTRGGDGKTVFSHRQAYADKIGVHVFDLPKGLVVRHTCDHPSCINHDHLIPGTHQDNVNDKVQRGRHSKGEDTGASVLTEQQAIQILKEYSGAWGQQTKLAKKYNVAQQTISKLIHGECWKHLPR